MKSIKIIAAASLSTRAARAWPCTPAARKDSSAAREVRRSSCKCTGTGSERERLRAIRRASCAASPSVPSKLSGKPITTPCASKLRCKSEICPSRVFQFERRSGGSGCAVSCNSSLTATPIRFVPRSRESRRPFAMFGCDSLSLLGKSEFGKFELLLQACEV